MRNEYRIYRNGENNMKRRIIKSLHGGLERSRIRFSCEVFGLLKKNFIVRRRE